MALPSEEGGVTEPLALPIVAGLGFHFFGRRMNSPISVANESRRDAK